MKKQRFTDKEIALLKDKLLDTQSIKLLPRVIYPKPLARDIKGLLTGHTFAPFRVR